MKTRIIPLLLALAGLSEPVQGATVLYTTAFGPFTGNTAVSVTQFDTALGTLTGVTLSWTVNSEIVSGFITNKNDTDVLLESIDFTNTFRAFLPSSGSTHSSLRRVNYTDSTYIDVDQNLAVNETYNFGDIDFDRYTSTQNLSMNDPHIASFQGTGTLPLYLTTSFTAAPTATAEGDLTWLTSLSGTSYGSMTVTYHYDEHPIQPVPEASSLAMGAGGVLLMAGAALRRRQRGVAGRANAEA